MERRHFIILSALGAVAVSTPLLHCLGADPVLDRRLSIPQTISELMSRDAIMGIGKAYGASFPKDYTIRKLEKLLSANPSGKPITAASSQKQMYSILNQNIQAEFSSGDTLVLSGWVLSVTESRQCALFSLLASQKTN